MHKTASLQQFTLGRTATLTAVERHQPALLDVKLVLFDHFPFVVIIATQGTALMLFGQLGFLERNNICHSFYPGMQP